MENYIGMKEWFLRGVAVVGLIAVLLLGAWGIIQLAVNLPGFFGYLGGGIASLFTKTPVEELSVVAPASAESGKEITLSWNHSNANGEYAYTISYACQNGLSIKAPLPNGSYQEVACNTPFDFINASARMTLLPINEGTSTLPAFFTVSANKLSTGSITSSGNAVVSVAPAPTPIKKAAATTVKKYATPATKYVASTKRTALWGLPDLATNIISVKPSGSDLTVVQFVIANVGTNVVPSGWTFTAALPLQAPYNLYSSQAQQALYPGDKILYTLTFSGAYDQIYNNNQNPSYPGNCGYINNYTYNGVYNYPSNSYTCTSVGYNNYNQHPQNYNNRILTINADHQNLIQESNENNNAASAGLSF